MNENFFNPNHREQLLKRLRVLTPSSQRKWGTMTVKEMLWHLRSQLELGLGIRVNTTTKWNALSFPPYRWLALFIFPWPHGSATPNEMNVKKLNPAVKDFASEKEMLLQRLKEAEGITQFFPHPFFGKMNQHLWGRLIWKHIDHHLRQFGA